MILAGQDITAALLNSLPQPLDTLTTGSVTNSAAETVIGTFAAGIPANDEVTNNGYNIVVTGTDDATSTPTIRIRIRLNSAGGNRIYDSGSLTASAGTAQPWWINCFLMVTSTGSSGTFDSGGIGAYATIATPTAPVASLFTAAAINTTVTNTLVVTAQWGTPSAS